MRVAVVGHVEWCEFVRLERVPQAGDIVHARDVWAEPGGAGAVAAVQLARLAGEAVFFTALGNDDLGGRVRERLEELGLRVEAALRDEPQRRAVVFVDDDGERTITLLSRKLTPAGADSLPWDELDGVDAVYFTGGDEEALRQARRARVLVATPRELQTLARAGVPLDVLVGSATDEGERYAPGDIDPPPRLVVATAGSKGGSYTLDGGPERQFTAPPLPAPVVDAYGAGDSFAAGLTFALGRAFSVDDALAFAGRCGAAVMTARGPYEAKLPN